MLQVSQAGVVEDGSAFRGSPSLTTAWLIGDCDGYRQAALLKAGFADVKSIAIHKLAQPQQVAKLLLQLRSAPTDLLWVRLTGPRQQHDVRSTFLAQGLNTLLEQQLSTSGHVLLEAHRKNATWNSPCIVAALSNDKLRLSRVSWCFFPWYFT